MNEIKYQPIGIIHTPHEEAEGTPIQPKGAKGIKGEVEVYSEYEEGLKDLEGFSHVILLFHCHLSGNYSLRQKPYMDDDEHGIFAMRGPSRPNPIGLSVVKLNSVEDNILKIENVDIIDETPLLDIKPFVPEFDQNKVEKIGWLGENIQKLSDTRDDGRFLERDKK
jgi:tRNA-Thr(GGU) m(6)t(6)A37 methyltransferase TsaA